ncbi:hypothetical protein H4R24_001744 [Coemansia sp. RSA 988]|nr:hypothetical protein H4R24_001744 [Coemansia sp. RSA 988]
MSDSDSDGFFSDIRAFRRELGLSSGLGGSDKSSITGTTSDANSKEKNDPAAPASQSKRKAITPVGSHSRTLKRQSIADISTKPTKQKGAAAGPGVVSPGEIAALLSPRGPRYRRRTEQIGRGTDTFIIDTDDIAVNNRLNTPLPTYKTPERASKSQITSPNTTPQQSKLLAKLSPASAVSFSPQLQNNSAVAMGSSNGDNSDLPKSSSGSPSVVSSLTMRSMWGVESSPISTPPRCFQPTSPLGSSKPSIGMSTGNSGPADSHTYTGSALVHNGLLGEVEDAIVTDEDMEQARRKLGQEQTFTQQQIIREIRERVIGFVGTLDDEHLVEAWRNSVTLLGQFHTCGHGKLSYNKIGLVWKGDMLGPIATMAECMGYSDGGIDIHTTSCATTLVFPWTRISNVRRKSIDENNLLMATVDEDLGIAFQMDSHEEDASKIDALVDNMNEYLKRDLTDRRTLSQNTRATSNTSNNVSGTVSLSTNQLGHSAGVIDLIRTLLLTAKENDKRFDDINVSGALEAKGFIQKADALISEFSQQLAEEARIALTQSAKDVNKSYANDNDMDASLEREGPPKTCTLCYTDDESVVLAPCCHRLCRSCFVRLEDMYISSSQQNKDDPSVTCICPWDRCYISSWTSL